MKRLKPFVPSLYSEYLLTTPLTSSHAIADTPRANLINVGTDVGGDNAIASSSTSAAQLIGEGDARGPGGVGKGQYDRGLGETFGYPGDARKLRERSKIKLWKEYFAGKGGDVPI
jgi:hypothetical protein